jgi:hypothetical protein
MTYTNRDVGNFYEFVRDHEADVTDLLRVPSTARVARAAQDREESFSAKDFQAGLDARYSRLKLAADLYFSFDRILIDVYNKTKHGAPMVRLTAADDPRRFEFIVLDREKVGDDRYRLALFTLDKKTIATLGQNVESMTTSITELAGLTRLLNYFGLLYEQPHDGEPKT